METKVKSVAKLPPTETVKTRPSTSTWALWTPPMEKMSSITTTRPPTTLLEPPPGPGDGEPAGETDGVGVGEADGAGLGEIDDGGEGESTPKGWNGSRPTSSGGVGVPADGEGSTGGEKGPDPEVSSTCEVFVHTRIDAETAAMMIKLATKSDRDLRREPRITNLPTGWDSGRGSGSD